MPQDPSEKEIEATVVTASLSIAASGTTAVGVSIGGGDARNFIGYDAEGTAASREVEAYVKDSGIDAAGDLTVSADSEQTILATLVAGSVGVAVGAGTAGVAASGGGVETTNMVGPRSSPTSTATAPASRPTAFRSRRRTNRRSSRPAWALPSRSPSGLRGQEALAIGVSLSTNTITNDVRRTSPTREAQLTAAFRRREG